MDDERAPAPMTATVPEAGWRYFRLGRSGAYAAAKRGDLPVIRIGTRLRVPIAVCERMLAEADRRHTGRKKS
jgi:hypothetical protein